VQKRLMNNAGTSTFVLSERCQLAFAAKQAGKRTQSHVVGSDEAERKI
jgi:hypothetical protein